MAGAVRSIVIDASLDSVFDVITAYDTYPQFLSECKEARITSRQAGEVRVEYKVDLMKSIRYTLLMKEERPTRVSWTFVEGQFMKDNKGAWTLESAGEGKTKATYAIEMALGALVPKSLVTSLVDASLPKMLEAFKKRVESRGKA